MKLEIHNSRAFKPISIVIESKEELEGLYGALVDDKQGRVPSSLMHYLREQMINGSDDQMIRIPRDGST